MNQKDPIDINKAAGLSNLDESEKRHLNLLPVGHGVVKMQDRWRQPFLVKFPLVNAKKGIVTDQLLEGLQNGTISWSEFRERTLANSHSQQDSRNNATSLEEGSVKLLHDIAQFPLDGVDARYKRLGVSVDKGNQWKTQLVQNGLARPERVKVNRTSRVILRLTDEARLLMLPREGLDPQASFTHEYWKRRVAYQLEDQGYKVMLEAPRKRGGGNMDISATRASESVAIEIETGKSDVVANVKRNLLNAQKVIVVSTDEMALQKVEQKLAKAGLLLPGRLSIMLRDSELNQAMN
ncbi:MAG: hypothetical protein COA78_16090 [Blastopirellula sp.]|nr:MAG: hypothetical protein COA78_16090 [Blastopirellula sp.]